MENNLLQEAHASFLNKNYERSFINYQKLINETPELCKIVKLNRDIVVKRLLDIHKNDDFISKNKDNIKISIIIKIDKNINNIEKIIQLINKISLKEKEIIFYFESFQENIIADCLSIFFERENCSLIIKKEGKNILENLNKAIKGDFLYFWDENIINFEDDFFSFIYQKENNNYYDVIVASLYENKENICIKNLKNKKNIPKDEVDLQLKISQFIFNKSFLINNNLLRFYFEEDPFIFLLYAISLAKKIIITDKKIYIESQKKIELFTKESFIEDFIKYKKYLIKANELNLVNIHNEIVTLIQEKSYIDFILDNITSKDLRTIIADTIANINNDFLPENFELETVYEAILNEKKTDILCTVIIPVYNVERFFNRCIESVTAQTIDSLEIICVNDGSKDASLALCDLWAKKDKRIRVIDKPNGGQSSARNVALKSTHGYYVFMIDSDDWIDHNMFYHMINKMRGEIDVVDCGLNIVFDKDNENKYLMKRLSKIYNSKYDKIENINEQNMLKARCIVCNKLFKSKIFEKNNITFSEGLIFEDNEVVFKYLSYCRKIFYIGKNFYNYYQNSSGTMASVRGSMSQKTYDFLSIFTNIYNFFINYNNPNNYKTFLTNKYFGFISMAYSWALDEKKPVIREEICKWSKQFNELYIENIKDVLNKKYNKVRALNHIVVSLTSYPARINYVYNTIKSLQNQTLAYNELVLYLADSQFPDKENNLPRNLLNLIDNGLRIEWCKDYKSYKKIIPALKEFSNSIIVTADDDIYYDKNWLKVLYEAYEKRPEYIHCHLGHRIKFDENKRIKKYADWDFYTYGNKPSQLNMAIGAGGILYQKHLLYKDILEEKLFMNLCDKTDDIWLWAMAILQGTKINIINNENMEFINNEDCDVSAMWPQNKKFTNDKNLKNLMMHYPQIKKILFQAN